MIKKCSKCGRVMSVGFMMGDLCVGCLSVKPPEASDVEPRTAVRTRIHESILRSLREMTGDPIESAESSTELSFKVYGTDHAYTQEVGTDGEVTRVKTGMRVLKGIWTVRWENVAAVFKLAAHKPEDEVIRVLCLNTVQEIQKGIASSMGDAKCSKCNLNNASPGRERCPICIDAQAYLDASAMNLDD